MCKTPFASPRLAQNNMPSLSKQAIDFYRWSAVRRNSPTRNSGARAREGIKTSAPSAADWPSFIEKSLLRADSFLARISDDDFQEGMAALRTPGDAINQNDAVTEEVDWFVFHRHG
jgi:hypothetical protein